MRSSVAFLGLEETGFGHRLAQAAKARDLPCVVLSLDGTLLNRPVTIGTGEVIWEGTDLLEVGIILVETPLFPWPQPQMPQDLRFELPAPGARISPEREARSLALSALWIASQTRPVWNPPVAAHLAASPAIALDRLAHAGHPVHPWSLEPAPEESLAGRIVMDCVGRDRFHHPGRPAPGDPAIVFDPIQGEIFELLLVGGRLAGARGHRSADIPKGAADLAARAARSLDLAIASVSVVQDGRSPCVLAVDAGPDLADWEALLDGCLAPLLVQELDAAARGATS